MGMWGLCMYVRLWVSHALRCGAETWHRGRGRHGPSPLWAQSEVWQHFFQSNPTKGHLEVTLLAIVIKISYPPNLVGRTPDQSLMHCWGQRLDLLVGQPLESSRDQIAQESPMATKFGREKPWPKCSAINGLKVIQRSVGVNQGSNCSGIPYSYHIGRKTRNRK